MPRASTATTARPSRSSAAAAGSRLWYPVTTRPSSARLKVLAVRRRVSPSGMASPQEIAPALRAKAALDQGPGQR